jgi:hypothetical protein
MRRKDDDHFKSATGYNFNSNISGGDSFRIASRCAK